MRLNKNRIKRQFYSIKNLKEFSFNGGEFVYDDYMGYIHLLKERNNKAYGELIINNHFYRNGWINKGCLGEKVAKEEWDKALRDRISE